MPPIKAIDCTTTLNPAISSTLGYSCSDSPFESFSLRLNEDDRRTSADGLLTKLKSDFTHDPSIKPLDRKPIEVTLKIDSEEIKNGVIIGFMFDRHNGIFYIGIEEPDTRKIHEIPIASLKTGIISIEKKGDTWEIIDRENNTNYLIKKPGSADLVAINNLAA